MLYENKMYNLAQVLLQFDSWYIFEAIITSADMVDILKGKKGEGRLAGTKDLRHLSFSKVSYLRALSLL